MLKTVGAFLVIVGSLGLSAAYRRDMQESLYNTRCFFRVLELLEGEIRYAKASLPEACRVVAGHVELSYKEALLAVYRGMSENRGLPFFIVWKQEMGKITKEIQAGKKEKELFLKFAGENGYADTQMQLRSMERCRETLGQSIKKQEEMLENKTKVVMSAGLIGGLFLTIVLL